MPEIFGIPIGEGNRQTLANLLGKGKLGGRVAGTLKTATQPRFSPVPAAPPKPPGFLARAGKAAGRVAAPVVAGSAALQTGQTSTEKFGTRFGVAPGSIARTLPDFIDPDIALLLEDLGVRTLGAASEVGDVLTFGQAGEYLFRDKQPGAPGVPALPEAAPLPPAPRGIVRDEEVIEGELIPSFGGSSPTQIGGGRAEVAPRHGAAPQGLRPTERRAAINAFLEDGQYSQAISLGASPAEVQERRITQQFSQKRRRLEGVANLPVNLEQSFSQFLSQAQQRRNAIRGLKSLDELEIEASRSRTAAGTAQTRAGTAGRATAQRQRLGLQKLLGRLFESYAETYTDPTTGAVSEGAPSFEEFSTGFLTGDVSGVGRPPQTAGGEPVTDERLDEIARQIQEQPGNEGLPFTTARRVALEQLQRQAGR